MADSIIEVRDKGVTASEKHVVQHVLPVVSTQNLVLRVKVLAEAWISTPEIAKKVLKNFREPFAFQPNHRGLVQDLCPAESIRP